MAFNQSTTPILGSLSELDGLDDLPEDERHFRLRTVGPGGKHYNPVDIDYPPQSARLEDKDNFDDAVVLRRQKGNIRTRLCSLPVFVLSYGVAGIWMVMTGTVLGSQVTSIQRHLGLTSAKTAFIQTGSDIGQLSAVLFGSHFGKYTHIPRFLSITGVLFGLATLAMSLGRLEEPKVDIHDQTRLNKTTHIEDNTYLCTRNEAWSSMYTTVSKMAMANNTSSFIPEADVMTSLSWNSMNTTISSMSMTNTSTFIPEPDIMTSLSWGYWLLVCAAMFSGAFKSPRIPLLTYYVERNIKHKRFTPLLLGSSFTAMVLGPPLALFLGSYVSTLPFDLEETSITPMDQRWIGAWWLAFAIMGIGCVVCSIPIMLFPRRMKHWRRSSTLDPDNKMMSTVKNIEEESKGFKEKVTELFKSACRLFKRPIYVLALVSACFNTFAWAGFSVFGQKYIETQFNLPSNSVSMITGMVILASLATGTLIGGIFTTKLKLGLRGCVVVSLIVAITTVALASLNLVFGCDNSDIIGLTSKTDIDFGCECGPRSVLISCGDDQRNYMSPCIAGCSNKTELGYGNCQAANVTSMRPGLCPLDDCSFFIPFLVVYGVSAFVSCCGMMPRYMMILRSVEPRDQSLAAGFMSFFATLIGMIPSPVMYGAVVDGTCDLWSVAGYCVHHDRELFRLRYIGLNTGLQSFDVFFLIAIICICIKRGKQEDVSGSD